MSTADIDLGEVLTVAQLAKRIKWSYDRTLTHLRWVNEQTGGMLLHNVSRGPQRPRWTLTLGALKSTHEPWFKTVTKQVQEEREAERRSLEERVETLERFQDLHTTAIMNINAKMVA